MVLSMFPRCSVRSIYASLTWQDAAVQFVQELIAVQVEMVTLSYVSLFTFSVMVVTLIAFTDCTSLPKKCITGVLVSCLHALAAFTILLVFECILEIATVRGTLGREGAHSLYGYFSSTLPDFSRLARFDVFNLAGLFAEFMKVCMTIFDGTLLCCVVLRLIGKPVYPFQCAMIWLHLLLLCVSLLCACLCTYLPVPEVIAIHRIKV